MSASIKPKDAYTPPITSGDLELLVLRHMGKAVPNSLGQKVSFISITPEIAESMQYWWMSDRQRNLKKPNLAALVTGMVKDMFLNNNPIWICVTDVHTVINGQHTLEAIVQTRLKQELMVVIDPCQGETDIGQKYALFDMGAGRTQADVNDMLMNDLDITDADDDTDAMYLDGQQITNSTQAMTWIMNNLVSNSVAGIGAAKLEKTTLVRTTWREAVCDFYRAVGERRDESIGNDDASTLWEAFHKKIYGPTFQSVFLVSLRARKEETIEVLAQLVQYAKASDDKTNYPAYISNLYTTIAHAGQHYGGMRSLIVWRTAFFIDAAIRKVDARKLQRTKEKSFVGRNVASKESWGLASAGKLPLTINDTTLDMAAAKERRARAGEGLRVIDGGATEE